MISRKSTHKPLFIQVAEVSKLESLRACKTLEEVARLLGYKAQSLTFILYKIPNDKKYSNFPILKRNGGTRTINAPEPKLKQLQSRLADLLYECMEDLLKSKIGEENAKLKKSNRQRSKHSLAHGFKKGLSIASNAEIHKNKKYVFNLDLEDFFPSINFGRVRGFFIKDKNFQLAPHIATILAQIACHDNALPQGSPCSPVISNLVTQILDVRLLKLAKQYKCTYSRYADDLTFSTNQNIFPTALAYKQDNEQTIWLVGQSLANCIERTGFRIKTSKTRMQYQNSRQVVTGLVVNKVVNTKSEYYRYARSMCHSLFTKGYFELPASKQLEGTQKPQQGTMNQLEGILSHIFYIKNYRNKYADKGFRKSRHDGYKKDNKVNTPLYPPLNRCNQYTDESHQVAIDGIKNIYQKFLFLKHFHSLQKPLIFCEGKTDPIYLTCALKQLAGYYPNLVEKKKTEIDYKIKFFKRTENVSEMLKLAEGAGGLKFIVSGYNRLMKTYKFKGRDHPVIMIVDNDSAGNEVVTASQKRPECDSNDFAHVTDNLYIIRIPKIGDKNTEIEDYFSADVLNTKLNGKKFHRKNDSAEDANGYGKAAFARDVVKRLGRPEDFSEFHKILDLISAVISDYSQKNASSAI